MDWGSFGVINTHVDSQRVVVMTTKKPVDSVWEEIFDSLVLEAEPPQKYVKRVIVTTKDGHVYTVSPQDFTALIEQEKYLPPGLGEIQSARMSLDFNRIKRDVDRWSDDFISSFDKTGKPSLPKFPKPVPGELKARTPRRKSVTNAASDAGSTELPTKQTKRKPSA